MICSQVISGQIIENLGIKYTFGICALIFIPLVIATFFFVPETVYHRRTATAKSIELLEGAKLAAKIEVSSFDNEARHSSLTVFRGRVSDESFWRQVLLPFPLFIYPSVIFGSIVYGSFFTWLIALNTVSVPMFQAPPYNLAPSQIGLTNLPLLGAGIIGAPVSGWLADKVIRSMAKRNNGIYEPEFRLTLMIFAVIFSTTGFLGLGVSVSMGAPLAVPLVFESLHSFAIPFATQSAYTYVTDCHPADANQAFVTIGLFKGIFTFIVTTFINGWFEVSGAKTVFWTIGGINLGICLLTVPMYVFGKRFRSLVSLLSSLLHSGMKPF